jgi:hypothetical protein
MTKPIDNSVFVLAVFGFEERLSRRRELMARDPQQVTCELAQRAMWILSGLNRELAKDFGESFGVLLYRLCGKQIHAAMTARSGE